MKLSPPTGARDIEIVRFCRLVGEFLICRPYGTLDEALDWLPIYHPYGIAGNRKIANRASHRYNRLTLATFRCIIPTGLRETEK
jgi:hypothetical protein